MPATAMLGGADLQGGDLLPLGVQGAHQHFCSAGGLAAQRPQRLPVVLCKALLLSLLSLQCIIQHLQQGKSTGQHRAMELQTMSHKGLNVAEPREIGGVM